MGHSVKGSPYFIFVPIFAYGPQNANVLSVEKIMNLNKNIFFQNLFNIKKQCNDLLILITQQNNLINNRGENNLEYFDYNKILIDFLENYTKKIENYNFENISLNNTLNNNSNNNDDE